MPLWTSHVTDVALSHYATTVTPRLNINKNNELVVDNNDLGIDVAAKKLGILKCWSFTQTFNPCSTQDLLNHNISRWAPKTSCTHSVSDQMCYCREHSFAYELLSHGQKTCFLRLCDHGNWPLTTKIKSKRIVTNLKEFPKYFLHKNGTKT